MKLVALLLAVLATLAGCATVPRDPLAARRRAYERLLTFIEPGMTRRQLYALLPPSAPPRARPPALNAIVGIALYDPLMEEHRLDADFSLRVQYRMADAREYPRPLFAPGTGAISPNAIDRLLFGNAALSPFPGKGWLRSRENPRDELVCRPVLWGGKSREVINVNSTDYSGLTVEGHRAAQARWAKAAR